MTKEQVIEWMETIELFNEAGKLIEHRVVAEMQDYIDLQDTMCSLISYITDGKLSKCNYTLEVMKAEVDDALTKAYEQGYEEGVRDTEDRYDRIDNDSARLE